jgi:hypothetical protein
MSEDVEVSKGKSIGELWLEASWFTTHTAIAIITMIAAIAAFSLSNPSETDATPKLIGTALAFFVPMLMGFLIARRQQKKVARYVWITGLVFFAIVCVWVLDLPTGNGLCENCLAMEKLQRTFFDISHGSGLMAGEGLAVGTWVPLSLFGYSIGAAAGLD